MIMKDALGNDIIIGGIYFKLSGNKRKAIGRAVACNGNVCCIEIIGVFILNEEGYMSPKDYNKKYTETHPGKLLPIGVETPINIPQILYRNTDESKY
jgi:hypothetical protein